MPDARISELPLATALVDSDFAPLVQSAGNTGQTRRATFAQQRAIILADRGAHVRDYGAVGDGTTNDAPAIQAAIDDLRTRGGGTLFFGPRVYRIASAISLNNATIRLQGQGFTEGPGPGQGTWLRIDSTGFTPFRFTGVSSRGAGVADIAIQQTHAAAQDASWAPTGYDFVFRVEDCLGGVDFENVYLCNINRGIYCRNSGRLNIRRLRGQLFTTGVEIDEALDVPRIHSLHFWTFWSSNTNVVRWQQANGDAMVFRRSDGVFIDQAFAFGYRSMFRFASSAAGVTTKFYIGQAYTDFVRYGVWLEASGVDGQIANLTSHQEIFDGGGAPLAGSAALQVDGSNCRVQLGNLRVDAVEDSAIRVAGVGNRVDLFALRCVRFNTRANGAPAISIADSGAGTPNAVYLGSPPLLESSNGGPLVNAGTNATLAMGAPAGRVARPGLSVGGTSTGFFQPTATTLAAAVGGVEVLRATTTGGLTLGGAPGGHALEVATPASAVNQLLASGSATGQPVSLQAVGADAQIGLALVAKGTGALTAHIPDSTSAGGNPRGTNAVDWQQARGAAGQVASGTNATIGGGINNTAGGAQSGVGAGQSNSAAATGSVVAGGINNTADGARAWVPGGLQATTRGHWGRGAWASGQFAAAGDAQSGEFILRRQTTNNTATRLTADGAAQGSTNTVNLPNSGTYRLKLLVVARQTGGSAGTAGDSASWEANVMIRRGATAAATVLVGGSAFTAAPAVAAVSASAAFAPAITDPAAAAWRLTLDADTTNGGLAVAGTGETNKTINWVARVLSAEAVG